GRIGAIGNAIVRDQDAPRAVHIDTVSILPRPTALGGDVLDAVGRDDGAVLSGRAAPDLDAVVGALGNVVVRDFEPTCVEAEKASFRQVRDSAVADPSGAPRKAD